MLKVKEYRDSITGAIFWRAIGNGSPDNATWTGRTGFVTMEDEI